MSPELSQENRWKPPVSVLFVMEAHDPFQHSFLRGVLIEGLGQRAIPSLVVRMANAHEQGKAVRHWRRCRAVALSRLRLGWLPAFVREEVVHALRLCVGTVRMLRRAGSTHIVVRNVWPVATVLVLLRFWLKKPVCYQDAFFNEEAKILAMNTMKGLPWTRQLRVAYGHIKISLKYWSVRRCDHVFVMSREMQKYYLDRHVNERRMTVMPMGVLPSMLTTEAPEYLAAMDLPHGRFILVYTGSLAPSRSPETMIDAFERAWAWDSRLFLLVVGGEDNELRRLAQLRPVIRERGRFRMTGRVPFDRVFPLLRCAQVGVSLVPPDDIYRVASVTKLVEMLACGLPVIANSEIPEQAELVRETGALLPCRFAVDSIAQAMRHAVELGPDLDRLRGLGREYAMRERNYDRLTARFLTALYCCQHHSRAWAGRPPYR